MGSLYQALLANGNWFAVYTPMIKSLKTGDNCILLSWLINQQHQSGDDEWIEIPRKTLTETFGYNKAKQLAIIKKLEELGVLSLRLEKMPTKRFARVVLPVIAKMLEDAFAAEHHTSTVGTENGTTEAGKRDDKGTENGTLTTIVKKKNKLIGESHASTNQSATFAIDLKDILRRNNRITKAPNLKQWAHQFQQLLSTDDTHDAITVAEVSECMNWLDKNFGDKYTPRIRSASEFCTKFPKLQDAVERTKAKRTTKQEHVPLSESQRKTFKTVMDRMRSIKWPRQTAGLETAIMLSVKNYSTLRSAIIELKKNTPTHVAGKQAGLQKRNPDYVKLKRCSLAPPASAVVQHYTKLHKSVVNWNEWHGKVQPVDTDGDDMRLLLQISDNDFDSILEMTGNA